MIDLSKTSGLPLEIDDNYNLIVKSPAKAVGPAFVRKFSEMIPVLLDSQSKAPAEITYKVTRGVCLAEHETVIADNHLTYDVTIVPPYMLGDEYNKTVGHYHD
ncbi:MAG: hypothetical protein KW804_00155, partial [Candidatus Doudnabacteria bacterium]|nr:hypothetical protein [Candidatus Doudnabacteria bacterium]